MTLLGTEACPSVSPHMYIVSDHYCIVLVTPTELVFFFFWHCIYLLVYCF